MSEQEQSPLDQGHGAKLDDYQDVGPAPEEVEMAVKAVTKAMAKKMAKAIIQDPIEARNRIEAYRAKRDTDEWINHRESEGIA